MNETSLNISISDVTKKYDQFYALKDVSLEIKSGEFMTLLGPSGSGKTTLLMVLAGFTNPDYGSVKFGDEEVILKPPHLRGIGMVFQNYALFPHMTVEQNVGYPQKLRGVNAAEIKRSVEEALSTVKLEGLGHRGITELSGGQRQRVALARLFRQQPDLMLADEPLASLDPAIAAEVLERLLTPESDGTLRSGAQAVVVSLHRPELIDRFDRVLGLRAGRLVIDTPASTVSANDLRDLYAP